MEKIKKRTVKNNYKSKWEINVADQIHTLTKKPVAYETVKVPYVIPESNHTYKPDFPISDVLVIEAKGKWDSDDRKKHLLLKEQHPELKICIVFQNANQKLSKKSKTTYGEWATKHSIEWSHKVVKPEWLK